VRVTGETSDVRESAEAIEAATALIANTATSDRLRIFSLRFMIEMVPF
jgi:hypothetical protein